MKQVKQPLWIEPGRGNPTLMLFSAVDDRSGADYEEYRCVYGEEAEAALRFLFNAMAPKPEEDMPFQGIPEAIYMDNGPVGRARGLPERHGQSRRPDHAPTCRPERMASA